MQSISDTDARDQFDGLLEAVSRDRKPVLITSQGLGNVVLLALDDYEAMESTLHLHSTSANTIQLMESLAAYRNGEIQVGALCDSP
jgi:prevent-host-death family protein